jgi:hypothetical protein
MYFKCRASGASSAAGPRAFSPIFAANGAKIYRAAPRLRAARPAGAFFLTLFDRPAGQTAAA